MIRRLVPGGLRGRLLLAFVGASALTLAVAAAVLLGPLQERLRDQSIENLRDAVLISRPEFESALGQKLPDPDVPQPDPRLQAVDEAAFELRQRVDVRVLVDAGDDPAYLPDFYYDSDLTPSAGGAALTAIRALREEATVVDVDGDQVTVAAPLFSRPSSVLVAQRRLTEVTTAVDQVRNALLAATAAGLLVAFALGIALSSTLLRRLARLRATARRITAEGPDAPAPRDQGRDEVGDLARALARMQEELRRQEAARRSFVATASHELRTPLTMLQGTMELLEEDLHDGRVDIEDAQLQVTNARRELRRLSALAGELLDLSRLDAAVQLRSESVELGELARAVAAEFHLRANEREVELVVVPPEDGCWARGDPDAIARVVRILIDNALRYGPPGEAVTLSTTVSGSRSGIVVADRGPGVPPEERERIFERFHRGRDAGPEGGFGLGLAIGRELAERMSGSLDLAERPGRGACFVLMLPSVRSGPSRGPSPAPGSDAARAAGAARWR